MRNRERDAELGLFGGLAEYWLQFRRFHRNGKLLLASTLLGSLSVGSFSVGYNLYLVELGIAEDRLGFLVGAGSLAAGAVAIPAGLLATRIGLKAIILWASAALAVGTALQILPRAYPAILAGNVLGGAGSVMWAVALTPLLAAGADDRGRPYLFTLSSLAFLSVTFAGNLLAGFGPRALAGALSVPLDTGYLGVLGITSLISGLGLLPLLFLVEIPAPADNVLRQLVAAFKQRIVVAKLLAVHASIALGAGLVIPFLNVYFVKVVGLSEAHFGLLAGAGLLTRLALTSFGPALGGHLGKLRAVGFTQLLSIPLLLAMAFLPTPILASAAYLGRGALMNMAQPLRSAFYMEAVEPDSRPAVNSLMLVSWNVAWAGGSAAGGALLGAGLSQIQFGLTATLYALASTMLLVAFTHRRKSDPARQS